MEFCDRFMVIRVSKILTIVCMALSVTACAIKDDIPFPIREGAIVAFEVEGQCDEDDNVYAEANIDKAARTVEAYVGDTVDLSNLTIKRFEVSNGATIIPEEGVCVNPKQFPTSSFWRTKGDTSSKVDFSKGNVHFTLRTYQDYEWKVRISQVIKREVHLDGQVGEAAIDPVNRNVVVYISSRQDSTKIKVHKFSLGGVHGTVTPDPTAFDAYDFTGAKTFQVKTYFAQKAETWTVYVYHTNAEETATATAFAHSTSVFISGTIPMGTEPTIEYHSESTNEWTVANPQQISITGARFSAQITGLRPGVTYTYRIKAGSVTTREEVFTTVAEQHLQNSSFEDWSSRTTNSGNILYQPWGEGQQPYWGTGNQGATTVGASNSTYGEENGERYANLQSKYIVIKFAAGNLFTGDYLETDGSNGVLGFGRPFTSFPTKMRFRYKYKTSTVNRLSSGGWKEAYGDYIPKTMFDNIKGQPDSCQVYIALGDWEPMTYVSENTGKTYECPYLIRTRPSALHLFNLKSPNLIAYAQMTKGENVDTWTTETLTIDYRINNRLPKYIIVVASSSKYGDYFIGGEGSLLQIDNIELLYE